MASRMGFMDSPKGGQGIFYPGRDFRIDGAGDDPVLFHSPETVCQYFLADAFQIFSKLVKPPGAHKQIS